jgi:type VI secretion system protein ImpA
MLREIPLTDSARFGKHSYKDIVAARTAPSGSRPPGDKTPSMAQVTAAFGDTKPDVTSRNHQAVQTILDHVTAIQGAVGAQIGNPQALNLKDLADTLRGMEQCLREFSGTATGETKVQTGSGQTPAPERGAEVVNGREDVLAALDKICVYYDRYEPGSPVPFLLRRARQWVNLDFMQIMQDLAPSSLEALKAAFGKPKDVKDKGS